MAFETILVENALTIVGALVTILIAYLSHRGISLSKKLGYLENKLEQVEQLLEVIEESLKDDKLTKDEVKKIYSLAKKLLETSE